MRILLLEHDEKERAVISQTLEQGGHQVVPIQTSEEAWSMIQQGDVLFLIADWDTSDLKDAQLIPRARQLKSSSPLYILLLTNKVYSQDLAGTGADDILTKPINSQVLAARVAVGVRFISMADSLAQARHKLETAALYDELTELMNRNAFFRVASGELERSRRTTLPISLIALDIDNLKAIQETHGRQAVDDILKIVGKTIREKSRPYDCIGRWTDDEFLIALPAVFGPDAEKIAERIQAGIHAVRLEIAKGSELMLTSSAGVASASRISSSTELDPLIEQARQSMVRAREAGGDKIHLVYI